MDSSNGAAVRATRKLRRPCLAPPRRTPPALPHGRPSSEALVAPEPLKLAASAPRLRTRSNRPTRHVRTAEPRHAGARVRLSSPADGQRLAWDLESLLSAFSRQQWPSHGASRGRRRPAQPTAWRCQRLGCRSAWQHVLSPTRWHEEQRAPRPGSDSHRGSWPDV